MTADYLWKVVENVPQIDNILMAGNLFPIRGDDTGTCYRFSYEGQTVRPEHAADIIAGEMKREMRGAFCGVSRFMEEHHGVEGWVAYFDGGSAEGDTEFAAVVAAYKARKEAKSEA